VHRSGGARQ